MPYVSTYPVLHPQNFVGRNRTVRNVVKQIEDFFVNFQKVRDVEITLMGRGGSSEAKRKLRNASTK